MLLPTILCSNNGLGVVLFAKDVCKGNKYYHGLRPLNSEQNHKFKLLLQLIVQLFLLQEPGNTLLEHVYVIWEGLFLLTWVWHLNLHDRGTLATDY